MNMRALLPLVLVSGPALAQLDLPVPIHLSGASPEQRQVTGLAATPDSSAAVAFGEARSRSLVTAAATGGSVLTITLDPPLTALPAGSELTIVPATAHDAGAQLVVDGMGPYALVKWGGVPLDSAELPVGIPSRMIFDGERFMVITSAGRPCRAGFSIASNIHCIADSAQPALNFRDAAAYCNQNGGRLCTMTEWAVACHRSPAFLPSVESLEWVDSASNSSSQAKLVGIDRVTQAFGCDFGDTDDQNALRRFRCCSDR
jgi:hypothetical protein